MIFKAIHGLAEPYISDLVTVKPKSPYDLRSNSSLSLEPPKDKMLSPFGARSFHAAAPCLWNSLPAELRDIQLLCSFTTVFVDMRPWKTKHSRKRFQNFLQSYVLSTYRIEIHQSQPASMT